MKLLRLLFIPLMLIIFSFQAAADDDAKKELTKYLNNVAADVKETDDPSEKREIMNNMLQKMNIALDAASETPLSEKDAEGLSLLKSKVEERINELNGHKGEQRIADKDLNAFADYSVQDLNQAKEYITISVIAFVLILILVALLL